MSVPRALRAVVVALCAASALAACGNFRIDPPGKEPAIHGLPEWTP